MGLWTSNTDVADAADREQWLKLAEQVTNGLRNFQILGAALKKIRDGQLYRFEFENFADCCTAKWKISVRHASNLIAAFETATILGAVVPPNVTERTLRPLSALPPDDRRAAFEEALHDGGTTAAVQRAVRKRKPPKKRSALKPLRLKVPGGTVVLTPNRKATTHEQLLLDALMIYQQRTQAA